MKCKICKAEAAVALKAHNASFCEKCYLDFFRRQVQRGIEEKSLFSHTDKILVAISGGKDSLSLLLELSALGYNVTGLFIDLAIPESSAQARDITQAFCAKHKLDLKIVSLAAEGLATPLLKRYLKRPICSVCGKIKRYYFNKSAVDGKYDVLATGHNLDDETARLFSNVLRWDKSYLSSQGPALEAESGFVRKVKPLWRLTEFEIANYAFIRGIHHHIAPCPYSKGASFTKLKKLLHSLETIMPGRKLDFYQGFLERGKKQFQANLIDSESKLNPCQICGLPTSGSEICGVCNIKQVLKEKMAETNGKETES